MALRMSIERGMNVRGKDKPSRNGHFSLGRVFLRNFNERLLLPDQGETFFPVHVFRMELNLCRFPNTAEDFKHSAEQIVRHLNS